MARLKGPTKVPSRLHVATLIAFAASAVTTAFAATASTWQSATATASVAAPAFARAASDLHAMQWQ